MNFQQWYNDADMPEQQADGTWVDLETGIPFRHIRPSYSTGISTRVTSQKSLDARAVAKKFGGKALTGSAKQKAWAEKIRAEKLEKLNEDDAKLLCIEFKEITKAKFWINHRDKKASEIVKFLKDLIELTDKINKTDGVGADAEELCGKHRDLMWDWIRQYN